jgi:tRNA (guanine37-N1)-methyltransferase
MFGAKVELKKAQKVQNYLKERKLLDSEYKYGKNSKYIYFPLKKKAKIPSATVIKKTFPKRTKSGTLKDILKNKLTSAEFDDLKKAYDAVGTIAILEIDKKLRKKEKLIALALLKSNKNIKTVLRKDASHEGRFRTQKMKWLAGEKTRETVHKENNIKLKLDVEKVYFSARLSTERKRIASQVKKGEDVLVMFSGCAPYPCVIAKNTKAKEIVGIEINPCGHEYAVENVLLNQKYSLTGY